MQTFLHLELPIPCTECALFGSAGLSGVLNYAYVSDCLGFMKIRHEQVYVQRQPLYSVLRKSCCMQQDTVGSQCNVFGSRPCGALLLAWTLTVIAALHLHLSSKQDTMIPAWTFSTNSLPPVLVSLGAFTTWHQQLSMWRHISAALLAAPAHNTAEYTGH